MGQSGAQSLAPPRGSLDPTAALSQVNFTPSLTICKILITVLMFCRACFTHPIKGLGGVFLSLYDPFIFFVVLHQVETKPKKNNMFSKSEFIFMVSRLSVGGKLTFKEELRP